MILDRYLNCQFRVLNSGRKDPPSFSSSRRCLNDYIFPRLEFCYSILSLWESYFPYPRNNFEFQRQYDTPYCSGRVQHLCFSSFQVGGCGFNKNYQFGNICSFLDQMSACPLDLVHCAWIGNFSVDLGTGRKEYHAYYVINALHSIFISYNVF